MCVSNISEEDVIVLITCSSAIRTLYTDNSTLTWYLYTEWSLIIYIYSALLIYSLSFVLFYMIWLSFLVHCIFPFAKVTQLVRAYVRLACRMFKVQIPIATDLHVISRTLNWLNDEEQQVWRFQSHRDGCKDRCIVTQYTWHAKELSYLNDPKRRALV